MFKLSEITRYLIADIRQNIIDMVSNINITDNTIDLADVIIFDNAAVIVNDLFQSKYTLVDTKDPFRNELLKRNIAAFRASVQLTDMKEAPHEHEKMKRFIQGLNEEETYNCCNSKLYPQITLTQLSRPGVRWTFSGDSWIAYGNYIASRIYGRNGSPRLAIFIETLRNSDRLYIVKSNSFVEFENTFKSENEIARVPYIEEIWTWKELFFRASIISATLLPAEFGKIKLVNKQPWKDAIPAILQDCIPKTIPKVTLNQYLRGVPYADPSEL